MKKPLYTIYALVDPSDYKPFYVGRTNSRDLRYAQHCNPEDSDKSARAVKIREILRTGKQPQLVVLERTTREVSARIREMFWIVTFKKSGGINLTNRENQKWFIDQYEEFASQAISKRPSRRKTRRKSYKKPSS